MLEVRGDPSIPGAYDTQPHLVVGVKGGTKPGIGTLMIDTGAAFSMVSVEVVRRFGLKVE
mgnify:FL=1